MKASSLCLMIMIMLADAEELFFDAIERLSCGGDRFVLVLAGNHDDPTRLVAGLPLASKHNIALVSSLDRLPEKSFNKNSLVKVVETGKGYIRIQNDVESAVLAYLPYPNEVRLSEKVDSNLSYAEKVQAWAEISARGFTDDAVNIFVSHLFMVGSKTNDGVVKVGDILAVPKNMLPKADYTALGHLHTPQNLGGNVVYSGTVIEMKGFPVCGDDRVKIALLRDGLFGGIVLFGSVPVLKYCNHIQLLSQD